MADEADKPETAPVVKPKKKKVPPKPPPPPHPDVGKTVWMTCRGSRPCGGTQATISMKSRTQGGGWSSRYRCQGCGTSFFINT